MTIIEPIPRKRPTNNDYNYFSRRVLDNWAKSAMRHHFQWEKSTEALQFIRKILSAIENLWLQIEVISSPYYLELFAT